MASHRSPVETVDARELHAKLGSKKAYTTWVRQAIKGAKLQEGHDFTTSLEVIDAPYQDGTRPRQMWRYDMSVEAAKHVCMVSGTEKGREIRQWFIDRDARLTRVDAGIEKPACDQPARPCLNPQPVAPMLSTAQPVGWWLAHMPSG